jgi:glucose/arabinose dehydrogenase
MELQQTFFLAILSSLALSALSSARAQPTGVMRQVYEGINGTDIPSLTNHPSFPNSPSADGVLSLFEAPTDVADNYGQRLTAYLTASATGNYIFWIASDDNSILYLSSNESPSNKQAIASVPAWTNSREWAKYPSQQSASIPLIAGQRYYIEALMKEGAGGDNLAVRWQLPNSTIEEPIPGSSLQLYGLGPPRISRQPSNAMAFPGSSATFKVQLLISYGAAYQWQRNNVNIPGGTDASYTVSPVLVSDNGAQFRCLVTNSFGITNTTSATLSISTNGVLRQVYTGISGVTVADLTNSANFPKNPSSVDVLLNFESPTDVDDNYGQRLRAFLTPPATGNYVFWIASDDGSVLYLGTNQLPSSARAIASVPDWTSSREWTKFPSQQSASIPLVAGQRYYIEALMKEGSGGDNLAVRWQLPDTTIEEPIPNPRLQVFQLAFPDSFTMRHNGKARVQVTANDEVYLGGPVQIVTPPAAGTAVAANDGSVLYTHSIGQPASDSFSYRLLDPGGVPSNPVAVTVNFTTARFNSAFVKFPPAPPATTWQLVEAFPGLTFSSPNGMCSARGNSNQLFLVESIGRVWLIPDVTAPTPAKVLFLDITNRVTSDLFERGAKGVACHPGFVTNGFIYVTYDANAGGGVKTRLSRFTRSTLNPQMADPATELILIDQVLDGPYHDIDSCRFGPDGYLYVSFGDEGGQNEEYQNAQRIDKDLYSSIIRIDVDKRPGNLEPNTDSDIPRDGAGHAYFSVPNNNPFIGATTFNKQPVNPAQVRTEIYVMGLRNPWQFSFDPGTDKLWVGDVQRDAREEVDLLGPGQNGGWSWREATIPGPRTGQVINGAVESDATLVNPVLEYFHGSATNQGNSVTGGFIYQGINYPGLNGLYVFGDFVTGSVWTFNPTNPPATFTRLTGGQNIAAFLVDPSNNDILLLQWGQGNNGRIMRLINSADDSAFPQTLTQTGFFADLADLSPNPGGNFYQPNLRFWSDYANKSRWFLITNAIETISYSRDGLWTFPAGMIFAKHFDLELDRGKPATSKRIETRFLIKTANSAYGVAYKWNDAGTEAFLVSQSGEEFDLTVTNSSLVQTQRYHIPSRSECLACHNPQAGSVLSFSMRQLNCSGTVAGSSGNLLEVLDSTGYLTGFADDPTFLPRHIRPDETQYSVESRVRSYFAVNCSNCHQPGSSAPPSWDARAHLNLWGTGLINVLPLAGSSDPSHRLILPGDLNRSIVWDRVAATNGYTRMPPIASNEKDLQAIQLLADWILTSLPARQTYDAWRLAWFGNLTSPQGERGANPDGDRYSNEAEFLAYTNPTNASSFFTPHIAVTNRVVAIDLPALLGRRMFIETSTDLGITDPWTLWNVPGNNGLPLAVGLTNTLSGPATAPKRFFNILIEEE